MPAVLLRLLLIVTLVLNGSGAAMASARMAQQLEDVTVSDRASMPTPAVMHDSQRAPTQQAPATRSRSAHATPPCHDAPGMDMRGMTHAAKVTDDASQTAIADAPQSEQDKSPHAPSPSHCDGGTCQCACLHVAQAMTALPRVPALGAGASAMPQPGVDAHVDPALPHLIRPPIA